MQSTTNYQDENLDVAYWKEKLRRFREEEKAREERRKAEEARREREREEWRRLQEQAEKERREFEENQRRWDIFLSISRISLFLSEVTCFGYIEKAFFQAEATSTDYFLRAAVRPILQFGLMRICCS